MGGEKVVKCDEPICVDNIIYGAGIFIEVNTFIEITEDKIEHRILQMDHLPRGELPHDQKFIKKEMLLLTCVLSPG